MSNPRSITRLLGPTLAFLLALAASSTSRADVTLRVGHFPNITHVQGVVAHYMTRQGKGWFEQRLGPGVKIDWYVYNAGPSAMEAIFANSIDLTYVGPSPALNAYSKSGGEDIRVLAGAAEGGSGLVVQPDQKLEVPNDFRGKKIATPQLGNTQDVEARAWLVSGGLKINQMGGDAQILPTANPDQLSLFKLKKLDAVWTVEPWLSRLEREAGGKVLVEDHESVITVLVSSVKFLKEKHDLAVKFAQAHRELTDWINAHPAEAQEMVIAELKEETKSAVAPDLVAAAWQRIVLTNELKLPAFQAFVGKAQQAGFMKQPPDLARFIEKL